MQVSILTSRPSAFTPLPPLVAINDRKRKRKTNFYESLYINLWIALCADQLRYYAIYKKPLCIKQYKQLFNPNKDLDQGNHEYFSILPYLSEEK